MIVRNNIIPFKGFKACNVFGIIFARKNAKLSKITLNHEAIHTAQMKEMLYVGFYFCYLVEWLVRLCMKGKAYKNISFEREAYKNERNTRYLCTRERYSWFKYLRKYGYEQ